MKKKLIPSTKFMVILRRTMQSSSSSKLTYQHAIEALNKLQSNAAYIRTAPKHNDVNTTLQETHKFLERSGITQKQLDSLPIIHVAGTKGKGSTCAFLETILRHHNLKTALYTSPHLITVRERIRLNGVIIPESVFTHHFWRLYTSLEQQQSYPGDMPPYFKFITILMFHVLINSPVDIAIIEVGIGGEYDCTNVIKSPTCIGITALGLDHMTLLGDTISSIAWQKSGIFKANVPAFTVKQPIEAMKVLEKRAIDKNCSLTIAQDLSTYNWSKSPPDLGIIGDIQYENAALAVKLAETFMKKRGKGDFNFRIVENSLKMCKWPGRTQVLSGRSTDFYLDGAHTVDSMKICVSWFEKLQKSKDFKKILIFNCIGKRNFKQLLDLLKDVDFDRVYFAPNVSGIDVIDQVNFSQTSEEQVIKCKEHRNYWGDSGFIGNSVLEILEEIETSARLGERSQVLITGSLHLVGAALAVLDPDLTMTTKF